MITAYAWMTLSATSVLILTGSKEHVLFVL